MEITYRIDGKELKTECTDDYIRIEDRKQSGRRTVVVTCDAPDGLTLVSAEILMHHTFHLDDLIMANGYQSWTETREFTQGEYLSDLYKLPKMVVEKSHLRCYGSQAFWKFPAGGHLGFDFSWIRGKEPFFIGSFNYKNAYLLIRFEEKEDQLRLLSDCEGKHLDKGQSFVLFDYVIAENGDEYFSRFRPRSFKRLLGYTSWYNHYQNISEPILDEALAGIDARFDLFQIDDGFESAVGDWMEVDRSKFPEGLQPMVAKIHNKGLRAGVWLAPFVAEEKSKLVAEHPDWIARDEKGNKIFAGGLWSGYYPLDLNVPDAVEYIRNTLRHYSQLGFNFFKLDYLYACNFKPLKGMTRCETSEFAYRLLREELSGKLILGCGAVLSNAFERFDYCRVGPDVSLTFDSAPHKRILHPERVSTRNTILNTIYRSPLNQKVFLSDPDVFMLRDTNNKLSFTRRTALTKLNALFGSILMTSDNVSAYDDAKKKVLEEALTLFYRGNVLSYERHDQVVEIWYELGGEKRKFYYDFQKGTLSDKKRTLLRKPALRRNPERKSQK